MKKSLRPQIVAPVQRKTTATTTSTGVVGCGPSLYTIDRVGVETITFPFAGDGAE